MRSPTWKYCSSIYLPKEHCTLYRDDELKVQLQVMEKRNWSLVPPREKCFYFIDGVDRVFRSEEELMGVLRIRFLGEGRSTPAFTPKQSLVDRKTEWKGAF